MKTTALFISSLVGGAALCSAVDTCQDTKTSIQDCEIKYHTCTHWGKCQRLCLVEILAFERENDDRSILTPGDLNVLILSDSSFNANFNDDDDDDDDDNNNRPRAEVSV